MTPELLILTGDSDNPEMAGFFSWIDKGLAKFDKAVLQPVYRNPAVEKAVTGIGTAAAIAAAPFTGGASLIALAPLLATKVAGAVSQGKDAAKAQQAAQSASPASSIIVVDSSGNPIQQTIDQPQAQKQLTTAGLFDFSLDNIKKNPLPVVGIVAGGALLFWMANSSNREYKRGYR